MRLIGLAVILTLDLLATPLAAEAQEAGKVWQIGFLSPYSTDQDKSRRAAFQQGLRDLGYVEGKNIVIEQRHADGRFERLPALAAELVRLPLDVLVAHGDGGVHAKQATSTIPIVVVANPDPVGLGIAASLARPGGNVTGLSDLHGDLAAKRLAFLKEAIPSASRIAVLLRSGAPSHPPQLRDIQAAASALRVTVFPWRSKGRMISGASSLRSDGSDWTLLTSWGVRLAFTDGSSLNWRSRTECRQFPRRGNSRRMAF